MNMNNISEIFSSVVMPVHNGEKYLREAIESVLNQTYTNFEFLIIENCSTDSSVAIIKSYNDPRIKLMIENDCGQVQAYNRGFKEAKGEYIFIHDHDDISHPERFEKQLKCMVEKNIDICGTFMRLLDKNNIVISYTKVVLKNKKVRERLLYDCSVIHNSSVCLKSNIYKRIGYWDAKFYPLSDVEFYLRAREHSIFGNISEPLYSWRKHKHQLSYEQSKKSRRILKQLELKYLSNRKSEFEEREDFYYMSLIFYYTDYLVYALIYNVISILKGKFDKSVLRYFVILTILGIPLKLFRKFSLTNSRLFLISKTFLNKML